MADWDASIDMHTNFDILRCAQERTSIDYIHIDRRCDSENSGFRFETCRKYGVLAHKSLWINVNYRELLLKLQSNRGKW